MSANFGRAWPRPPRIKQADKQLPVGSRANVTPSQDMDKSARRIGVGGHSSVRRLREAKLDETMKPGPAATAVFNNP